MLARQYPGLVNIQNIVRFATLCNIKPRLFLKLKRKGKRYKSIKNCKHFHFEHISRERYLFFLFRTQKVQLTSDKFGNQTLTRLICETSLC